MSEIPPAESAVGQLSPDGRWRWNGQRWETTAPPPSASGGWGRAAAVGIVCLIVGGVCGAAVDSAGHGTAPRTTSSTSAGTESPSPIASKAPAQPVSLSGSGSKVINVELASADYRVTWTATGHDNFIVIVHGQSDTHLINEIPPSPSSGEAFFPSGGGQFTVEIKASTLTWTITFTPV